MSKTTTTPQPPSTDTTDPKPAEGTTSGANSTDPAPAPTPAPAAAAPERRNPLAIKSRPYRCVADGDFHMRGADGLIVGKVAHGEVVELTEAEAKANPGKFVSISE